MMDHTLRTISYIADIGDLLVLMARRRQQMGASANDMQNNVADRMKRIAAPKMICHVFESEEAQFIAQSIGQAFQVAYMVSEGQFLAIEILKWPLILQGSYKFLFQAEPFVT